MTFTVRSTPPKGWPPEMARQMSVAIGKGPGKDFMTWTNADEFGRRMDADADGKPDDGYSGNPAIAGLDGRNLPPYHDDALRYSGGLSHYGIGVVEFIRRLRAVFPAGKLLLADGMLLRNSRAFELLNGIESEGFPHLCAS